MSSTLSLHRRFPSLVLALVLSMAAAACGDDDGPSAPVDPDLAPLVGEWSATSVVQTSKENPELTLDLIAIGGTFTLTIQENGRYVAELNVVGRTEERGIASVEGSTLTLDATNPDNPPSEATFQLDGNQLILDGDSNFNFPGDGTDERVPTDLHMEFVKR